MAVFHTQHCKIPIILPGSGSPLASGSRSSHGLWNLTRRTGLTRPLRVIPTPRACCLHIGLHLPCNPDIGMSLPCRPYPPLCTYFRLTRELSVEDDKDWSPEHKEASRG